MPAKLQTRPPGETGVVGGKSEIRNGGVDGNSSFLIPNSAKPQSSFVKGAVVLVLPRIPPLSFDPSTGLPECRTGDAAIAADDLGVVEGWKTFGKSLSETAGGLLLRSRLATLESGDATAS